MLPTLDKFLKASWKFPGNSYIKHPDFQSLYIRKNDLVVQVSGSFYRCQEVVNLANLVARKPGTGALKRLVVDLVARGKAIYVENAHESWLQAKLLERGFIRVDENTGPHFLFNQVGHLTPLESCVT